MHKVCALGTGTKMAVLGQKSPCITAEFSPQCVVLPNYREFKEDAVSGVNSGNQHDAEPGRQGITKTGTLYT